ncbi:MAG TPA: 6,7-dimethyl-8-ribityllumazine synthase [Bryobacteraceae bacterium]|jgi:6,7-dimethyl-8-ribityllumazine synthase|nr:6,7-dimethyl-8-ribityllumazine synthase [Bryobacteraceae bacterium]
MSASDQGSGAGDRLSEAGGSRLEESSNHLFEGELKAEGLRFGIIVSRFNSFITERLLAGALDGLKRSGASPAFIDVIRIPGAWEFPLTVRAAIARNRYDAIICLGAVIRGDTPHFDYVAGQAATGIAQASLESGIPVAFGVLTTNTVEQAIDRAGAKAGNKGFDAAMTAMEMANLLRKLQAQN